jgi:heme oxygenase
MPIEGSRRCRLRRATQPAHARLDTLIDHAGFLTNRASYASYLKATWSARQPIERALDTGGAIAVYAAWPERRICDALSRDLSDVTHGPPNAGDGGDEVRTPQSPGEVLGLLYVLEGSALGAQLLQGRAAAIGMTPHHGARHMAHQTSQPNAWSSFVKILDKADLDGADDATCIAAAVATFGVFRRAFEAVR